MPTSNNTQPQDRRRRSLLYLLLIVLLIIVNGVLFYTNMQTKGENESLAQERQELLLQKANFEQMIDSLKIDLYNEKGITAELDSIISVKVRELDSLKVAFNKQLSGKNYQIGQLKRELDEKIEEIKQKTIQYTAEINEWKEKYAALEAENKELFDVLEGKQQDINSLEKKLEQGAVLTATSLTATGIQYKGSGNREKETDKAKRTEKLRLCFKLAENRIAKPGYRDLLIKITSPEGTTLSMESLGSGTFRLAETGEASLYTLKMSIEYDPSEPDQLYCAEWEQDIEYAPGTYNFQVYQDGFLIGKQELLLDKGGLF